MKQSIILNTDSYKLSMYKQYPEGAKTVYSYIESRGGKYAKTVFFGLQAFIKEYLLNPITMEDINEAESYIVAHGLPFNREGWEYILREHNGYLPLSIKAVPEGTVLNTNNVLVTVENTDPNCFWLTTYVETALLRAVWYPTTVATNSREIKKIIQKYMEKTCDNLDGLPFKLHDFGARGVSSNESATLGGMAHLVNFMGTDTLSATVGARRYYGEEMAGFSIPASEHSTITSWGKENEIKAFENMLSQFAKPGALLACVSDSYDIYYAVEQLWGEKLRQKIIDSGATLVVRPDSGDPVKVVTKVVELLDAKFGHTVNQKGYKVLNNVRVIQGDGINANSITEILQSLEFHGYSAENIAFGMGGALLGAPQRDDQKFAMKASAIELENEWRDVFKNPITDPGKMSKKGRLGLLKQGGVGVVGYHTVPEKIAEEKGNQLKEVFCDGKLLIDQKFCDIRERAKIEYLEAHKDEIVERY